MKPYIMETVARLPTLLRPTFLRSGETYSRADFKADCFAGFTVAMIQVPQSMALALIAGLPAVYGLYASLFGFVASLWGSSRQLSTGPVAIVSFLTLASLVPIATPGTPEYIGLAATLALLVGLIYFFMGVFRLGFILQLVPHSVVFGFSSAAAVIIVVTQLPSLVGISVAQHDVLFASAADIVRALPSFSIPTILVGVGAMTLLVAFKRLPDTFPGALMVLALGVFTSYTLSSGTHGVSLVGVVPQSLPSFTWPWFGAVTLATLIPKAAIIALVGFVGTHASAKTAAHKTREHLDTDQELTGQGLANIVTSFFRGFPISGSFTRTAVNVAAGGRTAVSSVIAALITVVALLFFTPFFFYLPRAVLAAIVILSAIPLIDIARLRQMFRVSHTDGVVAFLTFFLAFILKPDDAIFLGIVVALMLFIRQTVWGPHVSEIGVDRELNILRGDIEEATVDTFPGVAVVRIGMAVYYANAAHIVAEIDKLIAAHVIRERAPVKTLVLDLAGVNLIDITAIEILEEYFSSLKERGINVCTIYLRRSVSTALERALNFPAFRSFQNIAEMRHALWLAHR
ncbi:MAG: SulP family inorganic anion transporter [Candidatus Paceibacterota bacterium]